jgi:hypothetical protein
MHWDAGTRRIRALKAHDKAAERQQTYLFEGANALLHRTKKWSSLKA